MDLDCQGGEAAPVNKRERERELKEKVSGEVCWIKLQYCLISLGKSLCACVCLFVCTEHRESTWHFIFELIARCPVAAPAARRLSEKLPLTSSAANKSAAKSDYDQERFLGMIQKKKYTVEATIPKRD